MLCPHRPKKGMLVMFGHLVCLVGLGKSKRYSNPLKWPGDCHFSGKFEENSIQLNYFGDFNMASMEGESSGSSIFETCATGRIALNHIRNDGHEVLGPAVTWYSLLAHGPRYVPPKKKEVIGNLQVAGNVWVLAAVGKNKNNNLSAMARWSGTGLKPPTRNPLQQKKQVTPSVGT